MEKYSLGFLGKAKLSFFSGNVGANPIVDASFVGLVDVIPIMGAISVRLIDASPIVRTCNVVMICYVRLGYVLPF